MKVCFVLLHSYPLFEPSTQSVFGGSEVRGWLLARGLARRPDFDVSVVVRDHGQPRIRQIDGIRVFAHPAYPSAEKPAPVRPKVPRWRRSVKTAMRLVPGLFSVRHRLGALFGLLSGTMRLLTNLARGRAALVNGVVVNECQWAVYREVAAEVYCVFGVSDLAAEVVDFCRRFGRKAIIMGGSDSDFSEEYRAGAQELNLYGSRAHLCHYALTRADALVVQTARQAQLLRAHFGRTSVCLSNPVDLESRAVVPQDRRFVLWVGKADPVKRPELCLELAGRCPEIPFVMIMNQSHPDIFHAMVERCPANVHLIERVPFAEVENYFAAAAALVNTSVFEGFPNTFLQAGKYGVPIASLQVDPDGFIERDGCGVVAHGDMSILADGLCKIWSRSPEAARFAQNIDAYVRKRHNLADAVAVLETVLRGMLHRRAA